MGKRLSFLTKFKQDITPGRITDIIKGFANLVNLVEPMKSFEWYSPLSLPSLLNLIYMILIRAIVSQKMKARIYVMDELKEDV